DTAQFGVGARAVHARSRSAGRKERRVNRALPQPSPAPGDRGVVNAFTIDVEDYFQVAAFAHRIDPAQWDEMPCRVERNVELLLELLARADVKATFFTLGWIAQRHP